jgi:copper(I)-binding protein
MMSKIQLFLASLMIVLCPNIIIACDSLELLDGWVKKPLPGTKYTAAYFSIKNNSQETQTINKFSANQFVKVMIHSSRTNSDGITRMHPVGRLMLLPDQVLEAEPGGIHLMLGIKQSEQFNTDQLISFSAFCGENSNWQFSLPIKNS